MDTKRMLELAGLTEGRDIISSANNDEIDQLVEKLAAALVKECKTLAKEIYFDEGAGKSGAKNEKEYVEYALKNFLDKEYQKAIMGNLIEEYNDLIG